MEIFNLFNRRYFADPETNIASPVFGQVTGMGWQPPRQGSGWFAPRLVMPNYIEFI
jgi:hypothetical protein